MAQETFELDFVLVRGPSSVDRRLHVRLPCNGSPITLGRASHCTALLDPSLLFSSQVQCSLFALPVKPATTTSAQPPTEPPSPVRAHTANAEVDTPGGEAAAASAEVVTPAHQSTTFTEEQQGRGPAFKVYMTDMCSSNGTFVNGLRISGTDPTELQQGDVCVFGGMRDVEVGETLPADAYAGPELVLWRVDMGGHKESSAHDFDFTATPLVLPARDVLAEEVRALMSTVQRSLPKTRHTAAVEEGRLSSTPAAQRALQMSSAISTVGAAGATATHSSGRRDDEHDGDSPRGVPQQLFPASPLSHSAEAEKVEEKEAKAVPVNEVAQRTTPGLPRDGDERSATDRRSVSLVALTQDADEDVAAPADPPAAMYYTAIRLGNVSFRAPTSSEEVSPDGPSLKRARPEVKAASAAASALTRVLGAPPLLTCTGTHVKWTMPNPNELLQEQRKQQDATSGVPVDLAGHALGKPFFGMLSITSISTVLACVERRGIAVELKDGCQLPLVDAAVLSGPAESRWVVWTLAEEMEEAEAAQAPLSSSRREHPSAKKHSGARGSRKAATATAVEEEERKDEESAQLAAAVSLTPEERFEVWRTHFAAFYRGQGLSPPHLVDAATFDLIFAPPLSPPT